MLYSMLTRPWTDISFEKPCFIANADDFDLDVVSWSSLCKTLCSVYRLYTMVLAFQESVLHTHLITDLYDDFWHYFHEDYNTFPMAKSYHIWVCLHLLKIVCKTSRKNYNHRAYPCIDIDRTSQQTMTYSIQVTKQRQTQLPASSSQTSLIEIQGWTKSITCKYINKKINWTKH